VPPGGVGATAITADHSAFEITEANIGVLEPGAVVLRGNIVPHGPEELVKVKLSPVVEIVFAEGPCVRENPWAALAVIRQYIANSVVPPLQPFLT
jgi:hypothetical protein